MLLLCLFPCLVILLTFLFCILLAIFTASEEEYLNVWELCLLMFQQLAPVILGGVVIWFVIAYYANTAIIRKLTQSHSLERKENKRVYNLVENLCMSQGMHMPKINVIEDSALNAFASGINKSTYTVTLSRGIINQLDNDELEAVIAHELAHIHNRDVRLLIVSIVFVGLFAMLTQIASRVLRHMPLRSRSSNNKGGGGIIVVLLIVLIVAAIGYFFARLMRFAISRNREYMADASAAEMTRRPQALASALRKIAQNPGVKSVTRDDIAQLFIEHPLQKESKKQFLSGISELFATHPPIEKRIAVLDQF